MVEEMKDIAQPENAIKKQGNDVLELSPVGSSTPEKNLKRSQQDSSSAGKTKKSKLDKDERLKSKAERERLKEEKRLEKEKQEQLKKEELEKKKEQKAEEQARKKEEREKRERERIEKLRQREEERQKREEERQKREEDKLKKEEEKQKREEEKKKKLEEKQKKLEEYEEKKRKKELERSFKEEEKEKAKAVFASFFVKKNNVQNTSHEEDEMSRTSAFKPFQVKVNMRLAPSRRAEVDCSILDEYLSYSKQPNKLYLENLRNEDYRLGKSERTWPPETDEVIVFDENVILHKSGKTLRGKMLKFHEDVRPAYWGTWRKKSGTVTARRPFGKEKIFDYEVDSEEEWEEEEPGESLSGTEDEKESEDEYEVDNEFFVPHGYLSDEEDQDEDGEHVSPDTQKDRLKLKEMEFEEEMRKKCQKIKPVVFGCIWMGDSKPGNEELLKVLEPYQAVFLTDVPILTSPKEKSLKDEVLQSGSTSATTTPNSTGKGIKQPVPEEAMPDLIKWIHGRRMSRGRLAQGFLEFWEDKKKKRSDSEVEVFGVKSEIISSPVPSLNSISKRQVRITIGKISRWCRWPEEVDGKKYTRWYVNPDIREKYGLLGLTLPNVFDGPESGENDETPKMKTPKDKALKKKSPSTSGSIKQVDKAGTTPTIDSFLPKVDMQCVKPLPIESVTSSFNEVVPKLEVVQTSPEETSNKENKSAVVTPAKTCLGKETTPTNTKEPSSRKKIVPKRISMEITKFFSPKSTSSPAAVKSMSSDSKEVSNKKTDLASGTDEQSSCASPVETIQID